MEDGADDPSGPDGVFDRYADGLHAYAHSLLRNREEAADATVDALLVAGAAAEELTDRTRLRPWLYALVRNEALRRCPVGERPPLGAEAAELTLRHRLSPADVAAVLGHPAEDADRLATAAAHTPNALGPLPSVPAADPASLETTIPIPRVVDADTWRRRTRLAAGRRAEVVRRARPFDADGFPVPLDRPRLSGRAMAWSAATAVAIALILLVTLPGGSRADTGPVQGPALAAAAPPPVLPQRARPQATLTATRLAAPTTTGPAPATTAATPERTTTRPAPVTDRGGDRRTPAAQHESGPGDAAPAGRTVTRLSVEWSAVETVGCSPRWAARLKVLAVGPLAGAVTGVRATWSEDGRERSATLRAAGGAWVGTLLDLPLEEPVAVTVTGSGPALSSGEVLTHAC